MRLALLGLACLGFTAPVNLAAQSASLIGNTSCATSTCHGGVIGRGPAWNHSMSTWIANDPHSGAGALLRDKDSRDIVERLDPAAADSPETYDTVLRQRCISCHATATPEQCEGTGLLDDAVLNEGVSCEACHGAASQWLDPHIQADWSGPQRFEPETGMIDTESVLGRAETCIRCHIGSRSANGLVRDMNHDLIAAGHPALRFDLLLYNENYPQHWDSKSEVETKFNESAIRVRGVGRAVNLAAAASLSAERARDHLNDPQVPWPELADYDCFACHQALSIREFNLPSTGNRLSPLVVSDGLPIWNAWHTVGQKDLTKQQLQALAPNQADPKRVAGFAPRFAQEYRNKAEQLNSAEVNAKDLFFAQRDASQSAPRDWHEAAIQYLEIDAALRDLQKVDARFAQLREKLNDAERILRFDTNPKGSQQVHSPGKFEPEKFRQAIQALFP